MQNNTIILNYKSGSLFQEIIFLGTIHVYLLMQEYTTCDTSQSSPFVYTLSVYPYRRGWSVPRSLEKKTLEKGNLDFNSTGRLVRLESVTKGMSPQDILAIERHACIAGYGLIN